MCKLQDKHDVLLESIGQLQYRNAQIRTKLNSAEGETLLSEALGVTDQLLAIRLGIA